MNFQADSASICIARAIALKPDFVVADEPSLGS